MMASWRTTVTRSILRIDFIISLKDSADFAAVSWISSAIRRLARRNARASSSLWKVAAPATSLPLRSRALYLKVAISSSLTLQIKRRLVRLLEHHDARHFPDGRD